MIEQLITYAGYFMLLINVLLYFKASVLSKSLKVFALYLCTIFIIQMLSFLLWYNKMENLYLSHFYFITQFVFLSLFYRELFMQKAHKKLVVVMLIVILVALGIHYAIVPGLFYKFNILEIVLTSLSLVVYSVIYFYNALNGNKRFMYINSGIFMYLLSSTLLFSSGNFITNSSADLNTLIWKINVSLYLIYQVLIFTEWYKNFRIKL